MSADLGFCGCGWESMLDRGRVTKTLVLLRSTCVVHFWEGMENDHECPDCGGLCNLVGWWQRDLD